MSITYLIKCGLFPGAKSENPDPRTTDDKFLIEFELEGSTKKVKDLLSKTGASEINENNMMMKRIFYNIGIFTVLTIFLAKFSIIQTIIQDLNIY